MCLKGSFEFRVSKAKAKALTTKDTKEHKGAVSSFGFRVSKAKAKALTTKDTKGHKGETA